MKNFIKKLPSCGNDNIMQSYFIREVSEIFNFIANNKEKQGFQKNRFQPREPPNPKTFLVQFLPLISFS
jgi:hypothetical protein